MEHIKTEANGLVQSCPACGQRNRIPYENLGQVGRCGKCGADIPIPTAPVDVLTEDRFERLIAGHMPVVVDFWAPWCAPCRTMAPELEKVGAASDGRFVIAKVDTQSLPDLARRYSVMSIPTLAVFRGGQEIARSAGARPAQAIRAFIDQSATAATTL